jgi:pyrimidine-nucleoside phosphorylase
MIDLSVGIKIRKKLGDAVVKGESLATLYANDNNKLEEAKKRLLNAYVIAETKPEKPKYVYAIITKDGVIEM